MQTVRSKPHHNMSGNTHHSDTHTILLGRDICWTHHQGSYHHLTAISRSVILYLSLESDVVYRLEFDTDFEFEFEFEMLLRMLMCVTMKYLLYDLSYHSLTYLLIMQQLILPSNYFEISFFPLRMFYHIIYHTTHQQFINNLL